MVTAARAIVQRAGRAEGPATILAIGTANPPNCIDQSTYSDFYFRVTGCEHDTELKAKFTRICERSMIKKRYLHLTEEMLKETPNMCAYDAPSLTARQKIVVEEVPKLGAEASLKAIQEWGQPISAITHLVFCTTSGISMPSADFRLVKILGLPPTVKRTMMYQQGCFAGGTALRAAKDLAENNAGARVLVVCSENTVVSFRGPSGDHIDNLVGQALFGDGAAAVIVGSDPVPGVERPIFEIVSAGQAILPESESADIVAHLGEGGLVVELGRDVPNHIARHVEESLKEAFDPLGISDWNSIFWIAHPGGPAILDRIEEKLGLKREKLECSRRVLSEYGNMPGSCVLFVMNEMRKSSAKKGLGSTGEGLDVGVLFGFGPGLTVETIVLRSVPISS